MTRVLHLIDNQIADDMLEALADLAGPGETVVSVGPAPRHHRLGLPVHAVHCTLGSPLLAGRRMHALAQRAEVIHAWSVRAARAAANIPDLEAGVVFSIPSADEVAQLGTMGDIASTWPASVAVTVPSEHCRQLALRWGLPERALHVLTPPARAVDDRPACRDRVRAALGLQDDEVLLACPAPMARQAGQTQAVWAHAIVWHIYPQTSLALPGEGPGLGHVRHFAASMPSCRNVHLTGWRHSRREVLAATDMAVFLQDDEPELGGLADAMAAGLPILATRTGETERLLTDGQDAVLVPPRVIRTMADGMLRLLDDPAWARGLGQSVAEKARRLFSPAAARATLDGVYAAVTAARKV